MLSGPRPDNDKISSVVQSEVAIITSRRGELIKDEKIETTFAAVERKEVCV